MTTKQNWPGSWVNRTWIFRKQTRGLQGSLIPAWGLGRDVEITWAFPMLSHCSLSVPSSHEGCLSYYHLFPTECTLPLIKVYNSTNPQWSSQINLGLLIPKRESRVLQFDLLYSSHSLGFSCACDISGIFECLGNIHNNNNIKYLLSTYYFRDMLNIHMLSHLPSSW